MLVWLQKLQARISREYTEAVVSVILRVPALFILEAWYKSDINNAVKDTSDDVAIIATVAYYSVLILAAILATIPLEKLVMFYMHLISLGLILTAYYLSEMYVSNEEKDGIDVDDTLFSALQNYTIACRLLAHLCAQCLIASLVCYLIHLKDLLKFSLLIFTLPLVARLCGLPVRDLQAVHNFCMIFTLLMMLFYLFNTLSEGLQVIRDGFGQIQEAVSEVGWVAIIITYWHAMMLPIQLLIFWIYLFVSQLLIYYKSQNVPDNGRLIVLLAAMGECCSTPVSLFALCITISYVSYYVLTLTKVFLLGWEGLHQDNDLLRGWTEGSTLLLIALQTGLLDLKPLQRAFLMSVLLFIVVSSLIQSMYEIVDPILLTLSASHSRSLGKHLRVIALCTVLWTLPLYMTYAICQYFDVDFWLMIIVSSCILTSVQVIGSLLVYWLFLYDTIRTEPWERLDDVVYYIRSSVRVLEFMVAVFVVCYGVVESIQSEWSLLNSLVLLVHGYFNVWQRLQTGWKTFLLRREAVKKIESLPEATSEQLQNLNDVCSICFQEMHTARITKCGHYFHGCCLRKWLYVKDACPLCHQPINDRQSGGTPGETTGAPVNINNINDLVDFYEAEEQEDEESSQEEENEDEEEDDISIDAGFSFDT